MPTSEAQGKGAGYQDGAGEQTLCLVARIVPYWGMGKELGAVSIRVPLSQPKRG